MILPAAILPAMIRPAMIPPAPIPPARILSKSWLRRNQSALHTSPISIKSNSYPKRERDRSSTGGKLYSQQISHAGNLGAGTRFSSNPGAHGAHRRQIVMQIVDRIQDLSQQFVRSIKMAHVRSRIAPANAAVAGGIERVFVAGISRRLDRQLALRREQQSE